MLQPLAGGITVAVLRLFDARSGPLTCCEVEQEHGMPDVFLLDSVAAVYACRFFERGQAD
jgi:hypothetical protein